MVNRERTSVVTFDVDEAVEEADGAELEEGRQVFERHLERVALVELQVHVDVQAQVGLDVAAQWLQQVL